MTKKQTNLPEQLHIWYLEAVKELKPESFNPNANKPYSEITNEQKSIDIYIANKIIDLISQEKEKWVEEIKKEIKEKELRLAKMETGRQWMRGWNECRNKLLDLLKLQ